jgi:AcrR family transcriptional regulator
VARSGTKPAVGRTASAAGQGTRDALVRGAVEALKEEGFAGASAREIARRAGCNQGLVFYHFGSVPNLLLAALDSVSETRRQTYEAVVEQAGDPVALVEAAQVVFEEDLDAGHIAVLAEMIAGTSATPGLGTEVAARIAPWQEFTVAALHGILGTTPLGSVVEPGEAAHAVMALYLGLEMLAHLDGDRTKAIALFARARELAVFLQMLQPSSEEETP